MSIDDDDLMRLTVAEILEGCGRTRGAAIMRAQLPTQRELLESQSGVLCELESENEDLRDELDELDDRTGVTIREHEKEIDRLRDELRKCGMISA